MAEMISDIIAADDTISADDTFIEPVAGAELGSGRRLRIAHVQLLPLLSGVQRVSLEEFALLDPEIYERTLICREPGPLSEAMGEMGVPCLFCPSLTRSIAPRHDLAALSALVRMMRRGQFDVVHTHSSKPGILGRIAARIAGVPAIVHTVHGFAFPGTKSRFRRHLFVSLERLGGRCCDAIVCLNDADRRLAADDLAVPSDRVHVIANGVDLGRFPPIRRDERARIRREVLGLPADDPAVVMVGRLWRQKDPLTFVKAAVSLLADGFKAHFVLIGDGDLRIPIEEFIHAHHAEGRIHLLGWRDDIPKLLPAFDIFALPSLWEGMPLAILEALACRLPCVVSDIPGNRDLIDDGVNGLLFPCGDVEMLATNLGKLLLDHQQRASFGRAGREKVEQYHDLTERTNEVQMLYIDLLTRKLSSKKRSEYHILADEHRLQRLRNQPR